MVLLICVAFISQALATTVMSYHMTSHALMNMTGMHGNKGSHQPMQSMLSESASDSQSSMQDCCASKCNCFTGGCSTATAALIKYQTSHHGILDVSSKIFYYSHLAQSHQASSVYRPPIIS